MDQSTLVSYLKCSERDEELFRLADETRKLYCGEKVHIRGILTFSNYCLRNCLYCGLRSGNRKVKRYRMSEEQIVQRSIDIALSGVKTIVLQSGDDPYYTRDMMSKIIYRIKRKVDATVTLCIGERALDDYRAFRFSGAERYLLKFETSNRMLYEMLHPGQSYAHRLKLLECLDQEGYRVGTGNIVGLPGQTLDDLCRDILFIKEQVPYMLGIGPFIPQQDTPLAMSPMGDLHLSLKVLALARLNSRYANIPATSALAALEPEQGQILGLRAGANVIMPDFTPAGYREHYQIYDHRTHVNLDTARQTIFKARSAGCNEHVPACAQ